MTAFYNEIEPYAAAWLRNLVAAGHIAPGVVDERSIEDIEPDELARFTQCHFFAGIGAWSYALRLAGWPDDRPVWTGSCPCQPFSSAGKGAGFADERHLWPAFHWLISQCRPPVVFGEQVASKDGLGWLDLVQADLEGSGYASAAVDLCAAGISAPHIRQRLFWVADALHAGRTEWRPQSGDGSVAGRSSADRLADADSTGSFQRQPDGKPHEPGQQTSLWYDAAGRSENGGLADATMQRRQHESTLTGSDGTVACTAGSRLGTGGHSDVSQRRSPTDGHWRDADWLLCRDGKWRPVEPGAFPLAHGATSRVGRLRAYGNAIVPQVAQAFIEAYLTRNQ